MKDGFAPAHARLSPSSADEWMNCPGSAAASEAAPERAPSPAAEEGTRAHALAERCLREGLDPHALVDAEDSEAVDMADNVALYLECVRQLTAPQGSELHVEQRVDLTKYVPDGFGTADAVIYDSSGKSLYVVDYKNGRTPVAAEENTQLRCYALGALEAYPEGAVDRVFTVIVQPRSGGVKDGDVLTTDELRHWGETVLAPAAQRASAPDAELVPGETQCQWCDARATCPALAAKVLSDAEINHPFAGRTEPLTPAEVAALLPSVGLAETWAKAVREEATAMLRRGEEVPGYKMVAGKKRRRWRDEKAALAFLRRARGVTVDQYRPRGMASPSKAEKLLRRGSDNARRELAALIETPAGAPTLVSQVDERPALEFQSAESAFADY